MFGDCLNQPGSRKYSHSQNNTLLVSSLVPRPLPDFIMQPWLQDKIWEWPGNKAISLGSEFFWGRYKTWTLDSGLDSGLDYVLDYGLDFGLDFRLESRICELA